MRAASVCAAASWAARRASRRERRDERVASRTIRPLAPTVDRAMMPTCLMASALPPAASCRVSDADSLKDAKRALASSFASFKQSASLTLQDAAGGNAEAIKKVGIVALSAVGAIGVIVLLATRSSRRSRREARRAAREAAAHTLQALKSDATEAL